MAWLSTGIKSKLSANSSGTTSHVDLLCTALSKQWRSNLRALGRRAARTLRTIQRVGRQPLLLQRAVAKPPSARSGFLRDKAEPDRPQVAVVRNISRALRAHSSDSLIILGADQPLHWRATPAPTICPAQGPRINEGVFMIPAGGSRCLRQPVATRHDRRYDARLGLSRHRAPDRVRGWKKTGP